MRVLLIIVLLGVFLLPQRGTSSACEGYAEQVASAVAKTRDQMEAVYRRDDGYQELAVSLLSKIRAIEDRLIFCGMRADDEEWKEAQEALGKLNVSTYPLRDLIVSERFPEGEYWEASDLALADVVEMLETKKPDASED